MNLREWRTTKVIDTKFTPGPWEVEETEDGHIIRMGKAIESPSEFPSHMEIDYDHGCLLDGEEGDVFSEGEIKQAEEARANVLLIAAAPEMYEALNEILELISQVPIPLDPTVLKIITLCERSTARAQGGES